MKAETNIESRLRIIEEMIQSTKSELSEQSFPYLLWGWLVFVASLIHYVLMFIVEYEHPYVAWSLMFLGGIIHTYYGMKMSGKVSSYSYTDKALSGLWIAFLISIFFLLLGMFALSPEKIYPFFILLYAIAIFTTGYILDFKPFMYGAISNWIIAALCLFLKFEYQLLLLALAILMSYIIPGYMLKAKFGK